MDDIRKDLPMSMIMAAFFGISWYIGIEINISLFLVFKRRRGLYFWSCALTSWGVILQPLFIILADFGVWKDIVPAIALIYVTWFIMVVPQSWVLYSRLHLLMHTTNVLRAIRYVLIFNSIVFSLPTMIIGTLAQATTVNSNLTSFNIVWDRIQLVVYFFQETVLSGIYIYQTRQYLQGRAPLRQRAWSTPSNSVDSARHGHRGTQTRRADAESAVLWQLVWANVLIISLDVVLLGIQCANMFHLQGAFKPCVYGIKLKLEFVILNRLIQIVRQPAATDIGFSESQAQSGRHHHHHNHYNGGGGGVISSRRGNNSNINNSSSHNNNSNSNNNINSNRSRSSHSRNNNMDSLWPIDEPGADKAGVELVTAPMPIGKVETTISAMEAPPPSWHETYNAYR